MNKNRIEILGVPVDCVDMRSALNVAEEFIRGDKPESVIAVNPEKVVRANHDPVLLAQLRAAGLLIPDGIGVVLAARLLRLGRMERVAGSELMPALCELSAAKGYRIFLLGGRPDVNKKVAQVLAERYQGIQIVGRRDGYFQDHDMPHILESINASGAQVLFVALGSPKQEMWMQQYLGLTNARVCQGVGGTFDVIAGRVKRAPIAFRKVHLEWFYRLMSDPRRTFRQTALPKFLYAVLREKLMGK